MSRPPCRCRSWSYAKRFLSLIPNNRVHSSGLNLSNEQIGQELDLDPDEAQAMTTKLREVIVERKPVEAQAVKSNAMKSMLWRDIRVIPRW